MRATPILLASLALVGAGCRDEGGNTITSPTPTVAPTTAPSDALGVAAAHDRGVTGTVLIRGYVFVNDDGVRICDAILESFPPQCGGAFFVIDGLDLTAYDLSVEGDVMWSDAQVDVLGDLGEDVLVAIDGGAPTD